MKTSNFLSAIHTTCYLTLVGLLPSLVSSRSSIDQGIGESSILKELQAECTREGINVTLLFKNPFRGVAYSHGHYETAKCRYISQDDDQLPLIGPSGTNFSFLIPMNECGTVYYGGEGSSVRQRKDTREEKNNENEVYIENTLLIQSDPTIQEAGDLAKTLRCVWKKEIHQPLVASLPIANIKSKMPTSRIGKPQKVTTVFVSSNKTSYAPTDNRTSGSLRFQMKGQVQSVPIHSRRHYSRALARHHGSYEDEDTSGKTMSSSTGSSLEESEENHDQEHISALPLNSFQTLVQTNEAGGTLNKFYLSSWKSVMTVTLLITAPL